MADTKVKPIPLSKEQSIQMEEEFFTNIKELAAKYEITFSDALFGWKEMANIKASMQLDPETLKKMMEQSI